MPGCDDYFYNISGGNLELYKNKPLGLTLSTHKYTGQREESSFGLYYYGGRWYDTALGRFVQADTIVPDGVQGLDRYAYVNNNPLKYTDPSGNMWCSGDGHCGGGDYSNSTQDILDVSHMNVENLDRSEIFVVTRAAQAIANGLGAVSNSMSAWEAFRYFFINGGRNVSFDKTTNGEITYSITAGNSDTYQLTITLPQDILKVSSGNIGKAIKNIVHEFGHAFEKSLGFYEGTDQWNSSLCDKYSKMSAVFSRKDYGNRSNDYWGFAGGRNNWQFTNPGEGFGQFIEVFADMFLGFTYNSWGTSDLAKQRSAWMTDIMTFYSNANP